jgi:hypothetical protein
VATAGLPWLRKCGEQMAGDSEEMLCTWAGETEWSSALGEVNGEGVVVIWVMRDAGLMMTIRPCVVYLRHRSWYTNADA